jgi:hypothetical protein
MSSKWPLLIVAFLLALAGLGLIGLAFLPYESLKAFFDLLKSNGNFESLTRDNAIVFRSWLGSAGAVAVLLAAGFAFFQERMKQLAAHVRRVFTDVRPFFASLRPQPADRPWLALLAFITLVGIVLRLRLIAQPFDHDEAYTYVAFASGSLRTSITDYHLINNHVFHSILVNLVTHAFGNVPWVVRLPAFTAAILCIPAAYVLAEKMYKSKEIAALSALLVAWIPVLGLYAANARGYTLVTLFTLLIFWLGHFLRDNKNLFGWMLLTLFSALGFYTVPIMIYPFGALFAWLFFTNLVEAPSAYGSRWKFALYWLLAGISAALFTLIFYTPIFIYSGPQAFFSNTFVKAFDASTYYQTLQVRLSATWTEWLTRVPPALTITLLLGFVLSLALYRKLSSSRVPLQLITFLWIAFVIIARKPEAWSKYWLFLIPPLMIWASAGLVSVLNLIPLRLPRGLTLTRIVLALSLLATLVPAVQVAAYLPDTLTEKGDVELATIFLSAQVQPDDMIVISSPLDAPMWYYSTRYGIPQTDYNDRTTFNDIWIIVDLGRGQTLDLALQDRGPDPALYDRSAARLVTTIGKLEIYQIPHH